MSYSENTSHAAFQHPMHSIIGTAPTTRATHKGRWKTSAPIASTATANNIIIKNNSLIICFCSFVILFLFKVNLASLKASKSVTPSVAETYRGIP